MTTTNEYNKINSTLLHLTRKQEEMERQLNKIDDFLLKMLNSRFGSDKFNSHIDKNDALFACRDVLSQLKILDAEAERRKEEINGRVERNSDSEDVDLWLNKIFNGCFETVGLLYDRLITIEETLVVLEEERERKLN